MHPLTELANKHDRKLANKLLAKLPVDYVGRVPGGRQAEEEQAIDAVVEFIQDVRRKTIAAMAEVRGILKDEGT